MPIFEVRCPACRQARLLGRVVDGEIVCRVGHRTWWAPRAIGCECGHVVFTASLNYCANLSGSLMQSAVGRL